MEVDKIIGHIIAGNYDLRDNQGNLAPIDESIKESIVSIVIDGLALAARIPNWKMLAIKNNTISINKAVQAHTKDYNELPLWMSVGKFVSWQCGERWATALITGHLWFCAAINTERDGDMEGEDADGCYNRIWWEDQLYDEDLETLRPATEKEIKKWVRKVVLHR